ncbi:MAG: hypothetical protein KGJ60_01520 [Verrucomicrobiota bacterium]|nr:hypothetical protein [Verrucomicrobiota bacterium]
MMNSMIGRWQTRMLVTGSAQVELYSGDIRRFVIPFIGKKGEEEVASAIKGAHAARARVRELLDRAKRAVGIAIKQDEKAAMESLEK